jgi:hypothetical protein
MYKNLVFFSLFFWNYGYWKSHITILILALFNIFNIGFWTIIIIIIII